MTQRGNLTHCVQISMRKSAPESFYDNKLRAEKWKRLLTCSNRDSADEKI